MATSWSVTTYRDPEKIDISALGNAMQYKQQNYNINVAETQQLINQYAGTDLLRDVDKEYFGERLNTLTNYINQSGTRDWSRKSIANEIQSYVSTALDKNVISAIASTNAFRKQQAEIEDLKKNKPDQYSMQNEWFATKDLQRYMKSGQVGDSYNAQSYVPYTDVKDVILKNADKLKEFGMEHYTSPIGGNSYFRMIGTFEKVDPETAKQYLSTIMDTKVMNQLFIDGQYSYKDVPPEKVKQQYSDRLDNYTKVYDERLTELRTLMNGSTKDKKAEYQKQISILEGNKNELSKSKNLDISKEGMSDYLYRSDFENKWTGFLSYNRLKDWKMDQTGFEMAKFTTDISMKNRTHDMDVMKFKADEQYRRDKMAQDDMHHLASMASKGMKGDGTLDPNNQNSGLIMTDDAKELAEEVRANPFTTVKKSYDSNYGSLITNVGGELKAELAKPENAAIRKKLGENNPEQIAAMMINSPGQTRYLYNLLSSNSKKIVDATISSKQQLQDQYINLDSVSKDIGEWANALTSGKTKDSTKDHVRRSIAGMTLDSEGNVVKGDVLAGTDKYSQAARKIAVINQHLMSGVSTDEAAKFRELAKNELVGTGMSAKKATEALDKLVFKKNYDGFLEGAGQLLSSAPIVRETITGVLGIGQGIYNALNYDTDDKSTIADDFIKYSSKEGQIGNSMGAGALLQDKFLNFVRRNEDINSIGNNDIDGSKLSFKPTELLTRIKTNMSAMDEKIASNATTVFNKSANFNTGTDFGKAVQPALLAQLPIGTEIQKDSNIKVSIDRETGIANIIASVKNGKEYEATPFQIKASDLPQSVLSQISTAEQNSVYSASNPYSVKYNTETELPDSREEWSKGIEMLPASQRTEAYRNPPTTKDDILNKLDMAWTKDLVDQNMAEIKKIMDTPVQVSLIPDQGQWTTVVKQGDIELMRQPTSYETYNPDLTEKALSGITTSAIEERLNNLLSNKRNVRK